jgi:hypothetical protein
MEWVDQESQFSVRDQEHVLVTLVRYVGLCPADDMGRIVVDWVVWLWWTG